MEDIFVNVEEIVENIENTVNNVEFVSNHTEDSVISNKNKSSTDWEWNVEDIDILILHSGTHF